MESIKRVKLSDISELITKGTTPTTLGYEFQDEGVNFLKIECFDENGAFIENKIAHISDECNNKLKRSQLQAGDILFSIAGAIGRVAVVTEQMLPANTNQALAIIRIKRDDVYLPYIRLILTSPIVKEQFERKKQGVAQLNISLKDINELTIPLPDKLRQMEYASLFDRISNVINARKNEIQKLDDLIKARFAELFDNGASPLRSVEEVCSDIVDCPHTTPKYGGVLKHPAIRTSEIKKGYITWDTMRYVSDEEYKERITRLRPEHGDIVYGREGTFGNAAILPDGYHFCLGQRVMLLRPDYSKCTSEYLLYAVISDDVYRQARGKNNASTVAHVNVKDVKKFRIPLPSIEKQNEFAIFVNKVDRTKKAVQDSLGEMQLLFDSLMQKYFG